ncbi:GDSL-type esterase/lipase family protein [Candidatus Poribacteria bacterium]
MNSRYTIAYLLIIMMLLLFYVNVLVPQEQTDFGGESMSEDWVAAMREVRSKFSGEKGTFAHFGDSITVSMAFWAPLPYARKNASPEMEEAFSLVSDYMKPECWREWKGPEYGNEGKKTARWAYENIDNWLKKLNPETAIIMFGTNDIHSLDLEEYNSKMRSVLQRCLDNGTVVILSTIPPHTKYQERAVEFAEAIREISRDLKLPLIDFQSEILKRRPDDWDGSLEKFSQWQGYNVPTLLARDGVHPSQSEEYRSDYSEEALSNNGFSLRNYLALMKYAQVIENVLTKPISEGYVLNPPRQPWFPKAPPLPAPEGDVIHVDSVEGLFQAVENVKPGSTIMVADGHYKMPRYLDIHTDNVTLRGKSGNREKVIIDGVDSRHGEIIGISRCSGVTIADLTIQNIMWNGFKINSNTNVQNVTIYNCIIHNIWQRGIKGVGVPWEERENMRPRNCRVQYCLFYNDRAKRFSDDPKDTPENFNGDYIGGMDIMYPRNWVISDNVFIGIQGRTRSARGAIFMWHDAEDCIIERNIIVDCDTGIALGNSHRKPETRIHCTRFTVRNNFVTRAPESGILADYTQDCKIINNTVHDPNNRLRRLIRVVHDNDGLLIANNLLSGPEIRRESASHITYRQNLERDMTSFFVDPDGGNLHLKEPVADIVDQAIPLEEITEDIDGQPRSETPDIGADEFR